jgi:hypothetical protein
MNLREWVARHGILPTDPTTEKSAISVTTLDADARVDLFHLEDYCVSTVSGAVVWLVPRDPAPMRSEPARRSETDLDVCSPDAVSTVLRLVADKFRESDSELSACWQDKSAGAVWSKIATVLERAAKSVDKVIAKEGK